ncbi:SNF2 family N-terminal domain containing protein, partial [Amanita muscaria]
MTQHIFGYSKSTRARCHGPLCNGSPMTVGTLRYGHIMSSDVANKVEWCHWGCVSPTVLRELAISDLNEIPGFQDLSNPDQQKIRTAIARGFVDPVDIPNTARAKPTQRPVDPKALNPRKRKTSEDVPSPIVTQSKTSQPDKFQPGPSKSGNYQMVEEIEEENNPEEEVKDELYCTMSAKVVGIQYYTGLVGPGEEVLLLREPNNRYDRNAIQVQNISRIQVGHLPRQIAVKLAPLLDRRVITVEGEINDGNLNGKGYTLSITLKFYGPTGKKDQLEPQLLWATPHQRGFSSQAKTSPSNFSESALADPSPGPSQYSSRAPHEASGESQNARELGQILNNLEKVDDDGRRNSLLDSLCASDDVLNLPLHPNPPGIQSGELLTDLLKHQSQALQWCIEREYPVLPQKESDKPVQFWQMRKMGGRAYYFNLATKTPQQDPPLMGRGAICADAMGLGKTLTMLALILATKKDIPPDYSTTTLIISPLSVLSNWEQQIKDHCAPGSLRYVVYYGANRSLPPQELTKYDAVITTYQTVSGEHTGGSLSEKSGSSNKRKKLSKTMFDVQWKRIILDEGHTIRNSKTKTAKAICALNAQRRWVLSGTPIINSPNDLGALVKFLQICRPLDNEDFFKRLLLRPLKHGHAEGVELLRALMNQTCIRRTKEMQDSQGNPLIKLPPVEMIRMSVNLNDEARRLYEEVEALAQQKLRTMLAQAVNINRNVQANALAMLTRLRQLALHPGLIPENYIDELKAEDGQTAQLPTVLTQEEKHHLEAMVSKAIEDCEECPICIGLLNQPRITPCGHVFCLSCITEAISRDPKCPMDRRLITPGDLIEPPPHVDPTQPFAVSNKHKVRDRRNRSAKIEQLIHVLKLLPPTDKTLVFSQFTSFMDKIAEAFEDEGISYVRFDGQMSAKRRQEAIACFSVPLESTTAHADTTKRRRRQAASKKSGPMIIDDSESATEPDTDSSSAAINELMEEEDPEISIPVGKGKGKAAVKGSARYSERSLGRTASQRRKPIIIDDSESETDPQSDFSPTVADEQKEASDFSDFSEFAVPTRKGKGKASTKGKATDPRDNPKVMLISLKAVCGFYSSFVQV